MVFSASSNNPTTIPQSHFHRNHASLLMIKHPAILAASPPSHTSQEEAERRRQFYSLIAGGIAGTFAATITCPLEVIKTKLQSGAEAVFHTSAGGAAAVRSQSRVWIVAREIAKNEGPAGFFRGLLPTIVGIMPTRSTYFWAYTTTKNRLKKPLGDSSVLHLISAVVAGIFSNTLTSPLWMVKTRMQLQAGNTAGAYKGYADACRRILKEEGPAGFFKGLSATYWGVSEGAIHFIVYEKLKRTIIAYNHKHNNVHNHDDPEHLNPYQYLAAAAVSKLIASTLTYPHEVMRTRMREMPIAGQAPKYTGMIQGLMLIAKEEGTSGLYAGMGPHLARVVPNTAIMFLAFETVSRWLEATHMNMIQNSQQNNTK